MSTPCQSCKCPRAKDDSYICLPTNTEACTPCRNVADLDEKIREMRVAILKLEGQRQEWKTKVNIDHDRFTYRMPPEIMSTIFEFCLPEDVTSANIRFEKSIHKLGAPLVLSAVCQRWRRIAHTTPRLWSDVPIHVGETNMFSLPLLAKEWVGRSGKRPLSINFFTPKNSKPAQELIKLLNQHASRWKDLKYVGESAGLSNFSSKIDGVSMLQTLSLETWIAKSRSAGKLDLGKFILQPKRLVIDVCNFSAITIDWNYVTELVMPLGASMGASLDCLEVLRKTPNLTTCTISRFYHQRWVSKTPVLLQNMMDLTLDGNGCTNIFPYLMCPALKTLTVKGFQDETAMTRMIEFLQRSNASVTTLNIQDGKHGGEDLDLLCRAVPTLHRLRLDLYFSFETFVQQNVQFFGLLTKISNVGGEVKSLYLPELRSLTLKDPSLKWDLLPPIFYSPVLNGPSTRHRKNLEFFEFIYGGSGGTFESACQGIDVKTRKILTSLKEQGVKFILQVGQDKGEFI